jgi:hypothetical protein
MLKIIEGVLDIIVGTITAGYLLEDGHKLAAFWVLIIAVELGISKMFLI